MAPISLYENASTIVLLLVGLGGLEPPTPRLSSVCSNQLSYRPLIQRCRLQKKIPRLIFFIYTQNLDNKVQTSVPNGRIYLRR